MVALPFKGGGYVHRLALAYAAEGLRLLSEGVTATRIENAGKALSMPMGPLALTDRMGAASLAASLKARGGDDRSGADLVRAVDVIERLLSVHRGASAGGPLFYASDVKGQTGLLSVSLGEEFEPAVEQPGQEAVKERLLTIMEVEALRCLEEGMFKSPETGDVMAVFGLGFAPWTGGPFSHIDTQGWTRFLALSDSLAERHGARFTCPSLLRSDGAGSGRFYKTLDFAA
ncbi:MAG: 3-hydroxyacyl-CoA dehydrogenase family protein [Hyphomicrobiaceae bacterium]